uniref:Leucine-rich repeat-containing N-terminal plant-type domain-containing protein n=1 Tax=Manihot esculenta TaxID=3983 RepID=A0A199UB97_MANES
MWVPLSLKALYLYDNKLSDSLPKQSLESIPEFLFHQFKLELLDLSHNNLKGRFPYWLLQNNGGLRILNLMNNSFNGQLEIGAKMLPSMRYLNLARNHFEGDLLFSAGDDDCKLVALDLSHNNFLGEVPERLLSNCISLSYLRTLSSLLTNFSHQSYGPEVLHLSNNQLHGEIPHWMGNITGLEYLNLNDNLFQGQIFLSIGIKYLDLSYNSLSGLLPSCFNGNSLQQINLQGNRFSGSIPETLLNISTLNSLDLSDNELSGTILNKSGENLSGLLLCQLNIVSLLDLSRKSFSGSISHWVYNLSFGREGEGPLYGPFSDKLVEWGIRYGDSSETLFYNTASFVVEVDEEMLSQIHALNLSHNQLTGSISRSFSNLSQIESLDLSYNILSGQIPIELIDLNFLEFSTFESKSYERNPFLCRTQVRRKCHDDNDEPSPSQMESPESPQKVSGKWYEIDCEIFLASFSVTFIIFFLSVIIILYVNPYW